MKNKPAIIIKSRDIAIGFLGWVIFSNLYFLFLFEGAYSLINTLGRSIFFLGLPIVIMPILFFAKKRNWIGIGIMAAILINMGLWIVVAFSMGGLSNIPLWEFVRALFLPFPFGFTLYM